jgi:hypothetical protein
MGVSAPWFDYPPARLGLECDDRSVNTGRMPAKVPTDMPDVGADRIYLRYRQRCLVIPVDVGKAIAMALVADHYGEITLAPFEFALTETGFEVLSAAITRAQHERDALVARLRAAGLEDVELNPRAVKMHADNSSYAR